MTHSQTHVLAQLLANKAQRQAFLNNRPGYLQRFNLDTEECKTLLQIDHQQLEKQAQGLLSKRWREVADLIPETVNTLGIRAYQHFLPYAESTWPNSTLKHFSDAYLFCEYLKERKLGTVNLSEMNRMYFISRKKRVLIRVAQHHGKYALHILIRGKGERLSEGVLYLV